MRKLLTIIAVFFVAVSFAQQKKVTGTVIDASTQAPLSGVTVQSKSQTVLTDSLGRFSVLANVDETLSFSYVGMQLVTMKVPASANMTVTLSSSAGDLNQVVVTGYQTQRKVDII